MWCFHTFALIVLCCRCVQSQVANLASFEQSDETPYINNFAQIIQDSYQAPLPLALIQSCKTVVTNSGTNYVDVPIITLTGQYSSAEVQNLCGTSSLCVLSAGSTLTMNGNLNVAALVIKGTLIWNDSTQIQSSQWLCGGYIVVEDNGVFQMSLTSSARTGYIYLKDNGALHEGLRTRAFGGHNMNTAITGPNIDITGRKLARTWSLLLKPVYVGSGTIQLIHDPVAMGWQVGDRILIAPTATDSAGTAEWFYIKSMSSVDNTIFLDTKLTQQAFASTFVQSVNTPVAALAAEVINLSRNIIFTGDDFRQITCDATLAGPFSTLGCNCNADIGRTTCTMGMHTLMAGKGVMKMQYSRVEKCGQRGVAGKYCLHFHYMDKCPDCVFRGNAIEFGQQRGIIVHETHLTTIEDNVLSDIRGAGLFSEDGNEMYNKFLYNVVICPWPKNSVKGGCTIPGTDNGGADATLSQSGMWTASMYNYIIGNRFANSFNGVFLDPAAFGGNGNGAADKMIDTSNEPLTRLEGNTCHGNSRFGTYISISGYYPEQNCDHDVNNNGYLPDPKSCTAYTSTGLDNGLPVAFTNNVDYDNGGVGGYNYGDVQWHSHTGVNNNQNVYWKETKNFADGCSAHVSHGHYIDGNMALPDMAAFIIQDTTFTGWSSLESAHHCNEGPYGFLCTPTYILSNVEFKGITKDTWAQFHVNANNYGGIFTLPPSEQFNPTGAGGFFPPGYCSLVSFYYSYLLDFGSDVCKKTADLDNAFPLISGATMAKRYSNGIMCKKPIRALKIYTPGLWAATANSMSLEVYQGTTLITSTVISFFEIDFTFDSTGYQRKQGYSFPVIADASYEYRLKMINTDVIKYPNGDLPSDWIIEFSDPVIGNRWQPDQIILTVQGRGCAKTLVTSQHDRRWMWTSGKYYPISASWGRGACSTYPDMPAVQCATGADKGVVKQSTCDGQCAQTCTNGFCDCGTKQCVCNAGFSGPGCMNDICASAQCGAHGKCVATYLGGLLPVSQKACVCDEGWSGPNCDGGSSSSGGTITPLLPIITTTSTLYPTKSPINNAGGVLILSTKAPINNAGGVLVFSSKLPSKAPVTLPTAAIGNSQAYTYLGCYGDIANERAMEKQFNDVGSIGECYSIAATAGYQYFALQYGRQCFASNNHINTVKYGVCGPDCAGGTINCVCTMKCSNGVDNCGGGDANALYQIGTATPTATSSLTPVTTPTAVTTIATSSFTPTKVPSRIPTTIPTRVPTLTPVRLSTIVGTGDVQAYTYLGCYGDIWYARSMEKQFKNVNSIAECYTVAAKAGYQYFALQYGGECRATNDYTSAIQYNQCGIDCLGAAADCVCTMKCNNNIDNCGGGNSNALFQIGSITTAPPAAVVVAITIAYEYIGCYGDDIPRAMSKRLTISSVNSIAGCYTLASNAGYQYFGLQYGGECWTSSDYTAITKYDKCDHGSSGKKKNCVCTKKCKNGIDNCGGSWSNAVYKVVTSTA